MGASESTPLKDNDPQLKAEVPKPPSRTIVCCFDGTGNKFGENSNIVRLFSALQKDNPEKQVVYYQPGIGTYAKQHYYTKTWNSIVSSLDQAVALHLNDHVKGGYQFIMENYRSDDKICLFGFSRGALIARIVMGMIYKIGILPRGNVQQLDFAFSVYQSMGQEGRDLSREFKKAFAVHHAIVEFVGVWDTVSSVGILPTAYPYTSVNYAVRTFRHALALDECRVRFQPKIWYEATLEREQELDMEEPTCSFEPEDGRMNFKPSNRHIADVEEVWFAGCHADIGGGSDHNGSRDSLSYVPLRWMIKEAIFAKSGIIFKHDRLLDLGFSQSSLKAEYERYCKWNPGKLDDKIEVYETSIYSERASAASDKKMQSKSRKSKIVDHPPDDLDLESESADQTENIIPLLRGALDTVAKLNDQLSLQPVWWMLELLPLLTTFQDADGNWRRRRVRNWGQGRRLPFHNGVVLVHTSVQERVIQTNRKTADSNPVPSNVVGYKPVARNWQELVNAEMISYVP